MQLIIDVGNTRVKVAVFDGDKLQIKKSCLVAQVVDEVAVLSRDYTIQKALISSVGSLSERQLRSIRLRFPTIILSSETKLPFKNDYQTPETLGVDRMGLVAAFAKAYPNKNGLIIDAGTCITYDYITNEGVYKGGAISPGLHLRYKSLHMHTAKLPLLTAGNPTNLVGYSTNTAIHAGIVYGVVHEIDGAIQEYKQHYKVDTIIITGGDAQFLSERLKNSIFAHSNFLLEGLNYILTFQND